MENASMRCEGCTESTTNSQEAVSKPQIMFKGKACDGEKAQHTRQYVSILSQSTTRPLGIRWGFEIASKGVHTYHETCPIF